MNKSLVKLSLISTLMLAANNVMALPNSTTNDIDNKEEAQTLEEEMLIQTIDPETGLIIYSRCPTLPRCDGYEPSMAELDQDQQ